MVPIHDDKRIEGLKELVGKFPKDPGVYLMKNAVGKILYVGKAKNLRNRTRSYFNGNGHSIKTKSLVSHVTDVAYMLTKTEVEAYLLEASLIKKHRPKYNIRLKDDKSYPYIKVSMSDEYPRLYLSRKVRKDGGHYFGPFTSGKSVWETIKFLNRTFQIRDCTDQNFRNRTRPCLTHQIGNCTAPCVGLVDAKAYGDDIEGALMFLKGRDKQVLKELRTRMKNASNEEKYEQAAKFRDSLDALKAILEKQSVINAMGEKDQDVVGYEGDERGTMLEVLHIRKGKLLGSRHHFTPMLNASSDKENPQEWLASFINQYYDENIIPDEVILPVDLGRDIHKLLGEVLKERSNRKVAVRFPTDTKTRNLLNIANKNASEHFLSHVSKAEKKNKGLEEIQTKLKLPQLPHRIECYDISNFQGTQSVASQVVFEDGTPHKDSYRRYKIKSVDGPNDFASMKEVLQRRLKHEELEEPNLIVVDGGKGQLGVAVEVLKELGKQHIPVAGLAKARTLGKFTEKEVQGSEERVFLPGRQNPVTFSKSSEALHILVGIRDEAHRFAITYHRKLRQNRGLESELDAVTGLGLKRKKYLLKRFESLDQLKTTPA